MRIGLALGTVGVVAAILAIDSRPSAAMYAAQLYPYCSRDSGSGATNCYVSSREQCGAFCMDNPWYVGADRARAWKRRHHW
jgi:hypothetical protein